MAKQRLINCDFLNDSAFIDDTSNKGKLLYMLMLCNADDWGFVGNAKNIIESLQKNDSEFRHEVNLELLENDYYAALNELVNKGLLYVFTNSHANRVYLIRHWWFHNKYKKGLWTNYYKYLSLVEMVDNEYVLKKSNTKENNKLNQIKLNQNKLKDNTVLCENETNEQESKSIVVNEEELNPNDYPFEIGDNNE